MRCGHHGRISSGHLLGTRWEEQEGRHRQGGDFRVKGLTSFSAERARKDGSVPLGRAGETQRPHEAKAVPWWVLHCVRKWLGGCVNEASGEC